MRILITCILLSAGILVHAQTGIRFTFLDFEKTTNKFQPNVLIGFDRDVAERLSIGLDVVRGFSFDTQYSTYSNEYDLSYDISKSIWGMQYRSQYFITDVMYLGTTLGLRHIRMILDTEQNPYYNSPYPIFSKQTARTVLVPVGLRWGFRSELDGLYMDGYISVGYNIGSAKKMFANADFLEKQDLLSKTWISIGYALGIGW